VSSTNREITWWGNTPAGFTAKRLGNGYMALRMSAIWAIRQRFPIGAMTRIELWEIGQ